MHHTDTGQANRLFELSNDIFSLASQLNDSGQLASIDDNFYDTMVNCLDRFKQQAIQRGVSQDDTDAALYALVAFIDERALSVDWPGGQSWMNKTLQWKYFNEHLAGEGFFERLIKIRQTGELKIDLIEIYYICLQLGFDGKYRMTGLEAKQALLVDIKAQLDGYRTHRGNHLSGKSIIQPSLLSKMGQQVPYWSIASISIAAILLTYSGFSLLIHHHANDTVKQLENQQTEIQSTGRLT